jgi:hypothetical protein
MKAGNVLKTKLFFCLFLLVFLTATPLTYALKTAYNFDRATYYQGENGTVSVTITNDNPLFQWNIRTVAIQFDWQGNLWYSKDVNTNVASGQSYTVAIDFSIASNVGVGSHSFAIKYVGMFGDTNTIATGVLQVHDLYEKLALQIRPDAISKLQAAQSLTSEVDSQAGNSHFSSPDAQSLLSQAQQSVAQAKVNLGQAQTSCNAADTELSSGSFQAAYNDYKQCESSADAAAGNAQAAAQQLKNATDAESHYNPFVPGGGGSPLWLIWLVLGVIIALIIGGLAQASRHKQGTSTVSLQGVSDAGLFCRKCGNRLPTGSQFCNKCGSAIE